MPAPAPRSHPRYEVLSRDPKIHEVIGIFLGFGRSYPPEILDDELLDAIDAALNKCGGDAKAAAQIFLDHTPREDRARCRAVLINLSRMRRENGGKLSWAA